MSRVILCAGRQAVNPYVMKPSGRRIYTVEELCYCLRDELDMLETDMLDNELADFLDNELGFPERAGLLRRLIRDGADMKSRLVTIFCSCDYYTKNEIEGICGELDRLTTMTPLFRRKKFADRYLLAGRYVEAMKEYVDIIKTGDASELTAEEYGSVLHNMGVIKARSCNFDNAAMLFLEAYERNNRAESLQAYLYALKLAGNEQKYINESMRLIDNREMVDHLENRIYDELERLVESGEYENMERLSDLLRQNRIGEFERLADNIIGELKAAYRADARKNIEVF